jgi:hypothetical protein
LARFSARRSALIKENGLHGAVSASCTNLDVITDMRNAPYIKSRLLIVAALALPAFVFTNGCKSTVTPSVTARGEIATGGNRSNRAISGGLIVKSLIRQ